MLTLSRYHLFPFVSGQTLASLVTVLLFWKSWGSFMSQ